MIIQADWQVRNSQRRYPIDEEASATGDDGTVLPEGFLVDASIWAPKYLYDESSPLRYLYVSSAMVSQHLVSLTILGCVEHLGGAEEFIPIASISLPKPIDPYKNYAVEPLLDGVMGWAVFGHYAVNGEPVSVMLSTPSQGMLAPKAARYYEYLPISGMSTYDGFSEVTGDVRIIAEPPVTAEIKDMRLYGESSDRKMLVLGLEQTQSTLEDFAGLCGKRPETNNCIKQPITSISGVAPDCNGNITITFDSEIIVRYFSNPLYPVPDPIPVRGGMCLDSVFTLDEACQKDRTLPDAAGLLPGEYTWERPCDLEIPLLQIFSDEDSFKEVQLLEGYAYTDGYIVSVTAGMGESAELAPCFATLTLAETATVRTHEVEFTDTPEGAVVGMFAFDMTNTRILLTIERNSAPAGLWKLVRYSKSLNAIESTIAQGTWGDVEIDSASITARSDRSVLVKVNGVTKATFVFDSDDEYYEPSGKAGIYVGGATALSFTPKPAVALGQYAVTDAEP